MCITLTAGLRETGDLLLPGFEPRDDAAARTKALEIIY
jgi:hypothetical protein